MDRRDQTLLFKSTRKLVGLPTLAAEVKRKRRSFVRKKKMGKISVKDRPPVLTKCCKNIHYFFFCQGMYLVSSKFSFLAIGQKLYFLKIFLKHGVKSTFCFFNFKVEKIKKVDFTPCSKNIFKK